ncbi:hypothetical protein GFL95_17060 [Rhizobium leguminosarum bv. viciae]|nr:hypothetical protein [Rhizobium leguminosarum bv. viciae]
MQFSNPRKSSGNAAGCYFLNILTIDSRLRWRSKVFGFSQPALQTGGICDPASFNDRLLLGLMRHGDVLPDGKPMLDFDKRKKSSSEAMS